MLENIELKILEEVAQNSVLFYVVYLLWKQYTSSTQRMYEREKEFYQKLIEELHDLKNETHELNSNIAMLLSQRKQ